MHLSKLFASNILWRGMYLFTSMIVTVLMARFLEAELTGNLLYNISMLTFVFMACSLSLDAALIYFSASGKITLARLFTITVIWLLIALLIALPVVYMLQFYKVVLITVDSFFMYAVLFIGGNLLITYFSSFFYARHQNHIPNLIFIGVNLLLIVYLLFSRGTSSVDLSREVFIQLYFYSFLLQGLLCAVLFIVYNKKSVSFSMPPYVEWSEVWKYASKAFIANLLAFLLTRVDYWIIELLTKDNAALGNYIQASRLVQLFQMLPVILATTVFPAVSSGLRNGMIEVIQTLSRLLLVFYLLLIVLFACIGYWLFPLVFGASFSDMYFVFLLLSPGLIATMVMALICSYLAAVNKIERNIWVSAAGLAFIISVDFIVIPYAGINGAAIVCSAGYIISFAVSFYFLKKEAAISAKDFIVLQKKDIGFLLSKLSFNNRNTGR